MSLLNDAESRVANLFSSLILLSRVKITRSSPQPASSNVYSAIKMHVCNRNKKRWWGSRELISKVSMTVTFKLEKYGNRIYSSGDRVSQMDICS